MADSKIDRIFQCIIWINAGGTSNKQMNELKLPKKFAATPY